MLLVFGIPVFGIKGLNVSHFSLALVVSHVSGRISACYLSLVETCTVIGAPILPSESTLLSQVCSQ